MAGSSIQSSAVWQTRLADLALSASCAEPAEACGLLRDLHSLLQISHPPTPARRGGDGEAQRLAALLAAGACASAALLLVAGRAGYMVSQGQHGRVLATVTLNGSAGEVSSEGASLALALTGALATALSGARADGRPALRRAVSLRLN